MIFHVHNFYNPADLFFLPSRGEGFAGVLMEAMLYKIPIVTSDIVGTRDIITHLVNGFLCEVEDIICYSNSIKKVLKSEELKQKFKENGFKTIQEKYLWKNNIKNFEKIYSEIRR